MTIRTALARGEQELRSAGCPSPRVDAEHLLAHALGATRTELYADSLRELSQAELTAFRALVERRSRREPLAYILGAWGFRRLTLRVDPRALIPRPETEALVERCLALVAKRPRPEVLDIGTGSGAIALAIADEHPGARVTGVESSPGALALARENLAEMRMNGRVTLVAGDVGEALDGRRFDLIVSNPPYVRSDEIESLEPEVSDWEPRAALVDAGQTERIAQGARERSKAGGWLVLECADERASDVAALLDGLGYRDLLISKDLAGRDRIVEGRA